MKQVLLTTTVCGTLLISSGAMAQTASSEVGSASSESQGQSNTELVDAETARRTDIVVVGIRGSVAAATDRKRNSKQIVDSVVSEDVGKLPDNNVPEALSRVMGVQITRERGQGQDVSIRGLSGVQTTINGNNTNLGEGRSLSLSDIPAELLKSVDVYKTRTADQVEGSIAGTVNVELRRPLDLKKGWTLAGSLRGAYDDVAKKVSPFGSVLIANRFETGAGEIGFLVNGSLTKTFYKEAYIDSESPDKVCCEGDANTAWGRLPANLKDIIVPYRTQFGLEEGDITRPSINAAIQWQPSDSIDFVLEGGYLGSTERRQVDRAYALMREPGGTLTDIQLADDGRTVTALTLNQANGIPVGLDSLYQRIKNNLYTTNFETHWRSDRAQINASVQYNWSDTDSYFVEHLTRPYGLTSASINFLSDSYARGVPEITLNGVDLGNIASYGVERFQDNKQKSTNKEFAAQADLTLKLSEGSFLRSFQSGFRFNIRNTERGYGYRDGFPRVGGAFAPLSGFPGGGEAELTGPPIDGALQWYRIPGKTVYDNIDAVRAYIQANDPGNAERFASEFPPSDQGQTFRSNERTFAAYGQINYAFDIGVPVDGTFGARYVNTWGLSRSVGYRIVDGDLVIEPSSGRGNYTDILPSVTALVHLTSRAQLRLSYTTNVQRPSFYDLRSFYFVDPAQAQPTVDAGNPELQAQYGNDFNASAEYFFGRGGQISLAGYYKKASNFFYFDRLPVSDLASYGLPGRSGFVSQLRNAGDGTFIGLEGTVQSFFDFLPGALKNFGASVNASYLAEARIEFPYPEDFPGAFDSPNTSKWTVNAALFYDTPTFSTRIAYNYRSPFRLFVWPAQPEYSWYQDATSRLDAAVNVTPFKFMTLSLEGTNLLGNDAYSYFGQQAILPRGVRVQARTLQASVRFRF